MESYAVDEWSQVTRLEIYDEWYQVIRAVGARLGGAENVSGKQW